MQSKVPKARKQWMKAKKKLKKFPTGLGEDEKILRVICPEHLSKKWEMVQGCPQCEKVREIARRWVELKGRVDALLLDCQRLSAQQRG